MIRGNALLVLDLGLDVVDGVARLNVEGNGLTRQGLDETVYPKSAVTLPLSVCLSFVSTPRCIVGIEESIVCRVRRGLTSAL